MGLYQAAGIAPLIVLPLVTFLVSIIWPELYGEICWATLFTVGIGGTILIALVLAGALSIPLMLSTFAVRDIYIARGTLEKLSEPGRVAPVALPDAKPGRAHVGPSIDDFRRFTAAEWERFGREVNGPGWLLYGLVLSCILVVGPFLVATAIEGLPDLQIHILLSLMVASGLALLASFMMRIKKGEAMRYRLRELVRHELRTGERILPAGFEIRNPALMTPFIIRERPELGPGELEELAKFSVELSDARIAGIMVLLVGSIVGAAFLASALKPQAPLSLSVLLLGLVPLLGYLVWSFRRSAAAQLLEALREYEELTGEREFFLRSSGRFQSGKRGSGEGAARCGGGGRSGGARRTPAPSAGTTGKWT
ncbi:MAG: hypothetical protein QXH42_09965 [Thermoplasmata archaeon]